MKNTKRPENQPSYSRRRFLRASRATVAALSAVPMLGGATQVLAASMPRGSADAHPDYYDKLGVTKLINAAGTYMELTSAGNEKTSVAEEPPRRQATRLPDGRGANIG